MKTAVSVWINNVGGRFSIELTVLQYDDVKDAAAETVLQISG